MQTIAGSAPFAVEGIVWEDDARLERESAFDAWEAPGPTKRPYFDRDVLDKTLAGRLVHALAIVDAAEKFTATEDGCHALGKAIHDHAAAARGEEPKPVCAKCHFARLYGDTRLRYMIRHPEVSTGFLCDQCHDADYRAKKGTGPCPPGEKGTEGQPGKPGTWDYQGGSKFFIPSETGKPPS